MTLTNKLFQTNNKKLLDEIMSKEECIIECKGVIDPKDEIFECKLVHVLSEGDDEYKSHLFI